MRFTKPLSENIQEIPPGKPNFQIEPGTYALGGEYLLAEDDHVTGPAIDRLAAFENMVEDLQTSQQGIMAQMEQLRGQGKEKTVRFKELMTKKLTTMNILILLKGYGIE